MTQSTGARTLRDKYPRLAEGSKIIVGLMSESASMAIRSLSRSCYLSGAVVVKGPTCRCQRSEKELSRGSQINFSVLQRGRH